MLKQKYETVLLYVLFESRFFLKLNNAKQMFGFFVSLINWKTKTKYVIRILLEQNACFGTYAVFEKSMYRIASVLMIIHSRDYCKSIQATYYSGTESRVYRPNHDGHL